MFCHEFISWPPWEKNEKNRGRKTEENYIKNGGKGLKNACIVYKLQNFSQGGYFDIPCRRLQTYSSGEKINLNRGAGGNDRNTQYIIYIPE